MIDHCRGDREPLYRRGEGLEESDNFDMIVFKEEAE